MSSASIRAILGKDIYPHLRKYLRSYPQWGFAPPRVQAKRALSEIGSDYGGYLLDSSLIDPDAVVYSLGVGEDISFDLALIQRFGVVIHAFDPTPGVKKWLAAQPLPEQFHFHDKGIADFDGEADFYLPSRQGYISHSILRAREYSHDSIQVPMQTLSTAMQHLGHTKIDVLKMDIEGAEYAVLRNLVDQMIPVGQILVEFHHRVSSIGTGQTRRTLSLLESYGMKIAYICPRMEVFTLVRTR